MRLGGQLLIMGGFQIKLDQTVGEEDKEHMDRVRLEIRSGKGPYPPAILDLIDPFLNLRAAGIKLARFPGILPITGTKLRPKSASVPSAFRRRTKTTYRGRSQLSHDSTPPTPATSSTSTTWPASSLTSSRTTHPTSSNSRSPKHRAARAYWTLRAPGNQSRIPFKTADHGPVNKLPVHDQQLDHPLAHLGNKMIH